MQAIQKHKFVHVLHDPGKADLSAYVDFAALKHVVKDSKGKEFLELISELAYFCMQASIVNQFSLNLFKLWGSNSWCGSLWSHNTI